MNPRALITTATLCAALLLPAVGSAESEVSKRRQSFQKALALTSAIDPNKAVELESELQSVRVDLKNCRASDKAKQCRTAAVKQWRKYLRENFGPWYRKALATYERDLKNARALVAKQKKAGAKGTQKSKKKHKKKHKKNR